MYERPYSMKKTNSINPPIKLFKYAISFCCPKEPNEIIKQIKMKVLFLNNFFYI